MKPKSESSILDLLQGPLCKQHLVPPLIARYFFFLLHQALLKPEQENFLQELSVESLAFLQQFLVPRPDIREKEANKEKESLMAKSK